MASELDELIEFLSAPRVEVRQLAVEIVAGLTGDNDGIKRLAAKSADVVPSLRHLLTDEQKLAKLAAEALVNLSQEQRVFAALLNGGGIEEAMALISQPTFANKKLLVMLLANMTQKEEGASRLLQEEGGAEMGSYLSRLVRLFTRGPDGETETYDHVANILVNVSRLEAARKFLLDPSRGLLRQILPQIESKSLLRRQGVAGCVRNCCFQAASALPSLLQTSQYLWPALLLPLAGPKAYSQEELDKMPAELAAPLGFERPMETDVRVKVEAAEAIYLIALQAGGRKALWAVNAPKILAVGYEQEDNAEAMGAFEKIGGLLVSGSMEEEEGTTSKEVEHNGS